MQEPANTGWGIVRYARGLTKALLKAAPRDEFVLYAIDAYDTGESPRPATPRRD